METILTSYNAHSEAIRSVRITVFVDEQGVPAEHEMDQRDPHCIHAVTYNDEGMPIATGRLDPLYGGKIGRVAVLKKYRGKGVGRKIMQVLEKAARQKGLSEVNLHAQTSALDFYRKLNYVEEGSLFYEENIPHKTMRKKLGQEAKSKRR